MNDELERNKRTAQAFYDLMFNQCEPAEAIKKYVGETYIQHNPMVPDGKQAFIDYFTRMAREYRESACTSSARSPRDRTSCCTVFRNGRATAPGRESTFFG